MNDPLEIDLEDVEQRAEIFLVADLMVAASQSPDDLDSGVIDEILSSSTLGSP
jgi:hypothetical protein